MGNRRKARPRAIMPFITGDRIDLGRASDAEITDTIRLIRSRLMP